MSTETLRQRVQFVPLTPRDLPKLPASAPTLAKHLLWALSVIAATHPDAAERADAAGIAAFNEAVKCLERLPFVRRSTREIDGVQHVRDQHGRWVPEQLAGAAYLVEDDYVSQVASAALQLNASLARFKALSMSEGIALVELMGQDYGIKVGGDAGNVSFYTYDRLYQVKFARADRIAFGAQIQAARELLEQWVREEDGSPALKLLINRAFGFDQEGKIRAAEVFRLATFDIPGDTWAKAMQAIRDAVQIIGKAEYMRVYRRDGRGKYELIPLDLASV